MLDARRIQTDIGLPYVQSAVRTFYCITVRVLLQNHHITRLRKTTAKRSTFVINFGLANQNKPERWCLTSTVFVFIRLVRNVSINVGISTCISASSRCLPGRPGLVGVFLLTRLLLLGCYGISSCVCMAVKFAPGAPGYSALP